MVKIKLHIEGFRGPWGWVPVYESGSKFDIVPAEDADVIFQCDPANWKSNEKYLGEKIVIANVLDFAEWVGGSPETEAYVEKFVKRATISTAISPSVVKQLADRGVSSSNIFHYPSQVDIKTIQETLHMRKQKRIISFCRLGDPGKQIEFAVEKFMESNLSNHGWEYALVGQEYPPIDAEHMVGVRYYGYLDRVALLYMVASSYFTLMPSLGEGLGLPAIESALVGTLPIVRDIQPVIGIMGENAFYFSEQDDGWGLKWLLEVLGRITGPQKPNTPESLKPWIRETAFESLETLIENVYYERK